MISPNAQRSLSQLFQHGLKTGLQASPQAPIKISPAADTSHFASAQIVVLSVSSYFFRMLVLIYFTPDDVTKQYLAALSKLDIEAMDAKALADAISECGNICCGSINRDLSQQFPHVGMSTPNILDRRCAHYLSALGSSFQLHFDIAVPQGAQFHASLCISEFVDLDFDVQTVEQQSLGELEMF